MLTKTDKQFLKNNFVTKSDLVAMERRQDKKYARKSDLEDLRSQLNDDIDGKLTHQKDEIVKDVGAYIADTIVPMFDMRYNQISRLEKKVGLPPLAD